MTLLSFLATFLRRWPLLLYAASWTALLTATVAVTSFSPEIAFVWATSPSSSLARACGSGHVRVPLAGPPGEAVCLPSHLFRRSKVDLLVPPFFAALVVAGSSWFIRAIGLWDSPERDYDDYL